MKTLVVVCALLTLMSVEKLAAQDATAGANVFISCAKCHGEKGEGNTELKAPKLSGQFDWYVVSQLAAFKSGTRKYKNDATCATGLSDKDMADVAAHVKSL